MSKFYFIFEVLVTPLFLTFFFPSQFASASNVSSGVQQASVTQSQNRTSDEHSDDSAALMGEAELRATLSEQRTLTMLIDLQATVKMLQDRLEAVTNHVNVSRQRSAGNSGSPPGGVTYVRWGRTQCPSGASTVYEGVAGTARYNVGGGGSEIICLHNTPIWKEVLPGAVETSHIGGVEYEFHNFPFSSSNHGGNSLMDHDMPCVVCQVRTRTAQIMIPARDVCPHGWTSEYWGYLVSELSPSGNRHRGSYTCLDSDPEVVYGGSVNVSPGVVYPVGSQCGVGLACPPFVSGYGILCVVCSI